MSDEPLFEVRQIDERLDYEQHSYVHLDRPLFTVSLPHQCGAWEVTPEPLPRAEAIAALERFIAEAQTALAELQSSS